MSGALTAALVSGAAATPYGFSTGFEVVGAGYDHLSAFEPSSQFVSSSFAPLLQYRGATPTMRLHVYARRGFTSYHGARVDSIVRGGVQTLDHAFVSYVRPGPIVDPLTLQGSYQRSRDALDLNERLLLNQADVTHWNTAGSMVLPWAEAHEDAHGWYYGSDLASAQSFDTQLRAVPLRGSFTSLFGEWTDRVLMLGTHVALHAWLAGGGVRRQVNPWIWLELAGGLARTRWSDGTSKSGPGGRFALQTGRNVPEIVSLEIEARPDLPSSFSGEIGYRLADGSVRLRGDWQPDVEGGIASTVELTRRIAVVAEDTLGRATVVGGEVGYGRLTPLHQDGPRAETIHASGWVLRRVRSWLSARVAGGFLRQPVVLENDEPLVRRMRLDVALIALFPGEGAATGAW